MEEGNVCSCCDGLQWTGRHLGGFHLQTERSTKIYDRDLGQHWFPYPDHWRCGSFCAVLLACQWAAEEGQEAAGEDLAIQIYILKVLNMILLIKDNVETQLADG